MFTLLNLAIVVGAGLVMLVALLLYTWWKNPLVDENEQPIASPGLSAIEFPEQSTVIAKDQPQYRPLPALMIEDSTGTMITCWHFTFRDRLKILFGGKLWCSVWTFDQAITPLYFSVDKRDVIGIPSAK